MVLQGSPVGDPDWVDITTESVFQGSGTRCYLRVRDDRAELSCELTLPIGAIVYKHRGSAAWEVG